MLQQIKKLNSSLARQSNKVLVAGLAAIVARNWQLWQTDKQRVGAESQLRPRLSRTPKVSVLVAAWNERELIEAHLTSFLALQYPQIELVLCAGGPDGTFEKALEYAGERIIVLPQKPGEGKQRSLARCLARSNGELIYLTDADCLYDEEALGWLLSAVIEEAETVATGRFKPLPQQARHPFALNQWAVDNYARHRLGRYVEGLIGRNALLTRSVLEASQALEEKVTIGTDYYLARKLLAQGHQIRNVNNSLVPSDYHLKIRPYFRQQTRWLRNIVKHSRSFGQTDQTFNVLRNCSTGLVFYGLGLLWGATGSRLVRNMWLLAWNYATLNRVRYLAFARQGGHPVSAAAFWQAPFYAALDFSMLANAGLDILLEKRDRW